MEPIRKYKAVLAKNVNYVFAKALLSYCLEYCERFYFPLKKMKSANKEIINEG